MNSPVRFYRIPFDVPGESLPGPEIVGNKAHNLMRMARRVPVPPGFVIPAEFCRRYRENKGETLAQINASLGKELANLSYLTGREFSGKRSPFLVSVRSGAAVSMPGMMETVLNIGLNEDTLRGLVRLTGNPKFAWDCMLRFIQQYGEVVHGLSSDSFDQALEKFLRNCDAAGPEELDIDSLRKVTTEFSGLFRQQTGRLFPVSPDEQLASAIEAVLRSWYGKRAAAYRKLHAIPDEIGTAVIVQVMVFGNTGRSSGAGVGFTRNPATGEKEPYLDYLSNAQGEDIVSGRRNADHAGMLALHFPKVHVELIQVCGWLEKEFRDMQDFEFTVEQGSLYLLQSRSGKRTGLAALKIAADLVADGLVEPARALEMIAGYDPASFSRVSLTVAEDRVPTGVAVSAGTGVAVGTAVFDANRLDLYLDKGRPVIFLARTLSTDDIEVMHRVQGLVTQFGARTSHAAVVARQLGKVCLVGCATLRIGEDLRHCTFGETRIEEGDTLSLDGDSGRIFQGEIPLVVSRPAALLEKVAAWQEEIRQNRAREDKDRESCAEPTPRLAHEPNQIQ